MQYIDELDSYRNTEKAAVTFGKFDGLHKGHQKLIGTVKELGENEGLLSVVCAFDMHKSGVLMTVEERELHLENEVDCLVNMTFTKEFGATSAEDFIRNVIHGIFHAAYVVVGTDFRFGHGKRGDIHMLRQYEEQYGYKLIVIEKERFENHIISSTYIKEMLEKGETALANQMLGYGYGISGVVEHGKKLGRTLGFPTVNVAWPKEKLIPPMGVYCCRVYIDGKGYNGIANIGVKPTVSEEGRVCMESYLFGYEGEAYGKEVMAELLSYVRPEQKFADKEELKKYVDKDIISGKEYFRIK